MLQEAGPRGAGGMARRDLAEREVPPPLSY